jgi:trk system potassium uptake protein TrkA
MEIVILGGGRVGLNLASFLISDGHDITLIENDKQKCQIIAPELDATVICGSGTETTTLEEANLGDADFFVAATGNDEVNLLACILAKDFEIPTTMARISDPNHEEAFKKVGIDIVVNPEVTAAGYLERILLRPQIADLAVIGKGEAELLDFTLQESEFVGKRIGEVSPTENYVIVAVHSNGDIIIPDQDTVLQSGFKISLLVKTKFAKEVLKRFTKNVTIYDSFSNLTGSLDQQLKDYEYD